MTIEWNKVTRYSKVVAVVLFGGTFFLGFWLGEMNAEEIYVKVPCFDACKSDSSTMGIEQEGASSQSFQTNTQKDRIVDHISCDHMTQYVRTITGECGSAEQKEVLFDESNAPLSNAEFKQQAAAKAAIVLTRAENMRIEKFEHILAAFDLQITQREQFGDMYERYIQDLQQQKNTFMTLEKEWEKYRDMFCGVAISSIPPEAIGTNATDYFVKIDCAANITESHIVEFREIEQSGIFDSPARG